MIEFQDTDFCIMICLKFQADYYVLILIKPLLELKKSASSPDSSSLLFMMKASDGLTLCEQLS
jgi:hypothetical protein